MKLKGKKIFGLVFLLIAVILVLGLFGGCVRGMSPIGWSGGTIADGNLYVGSNEGRLVSLNLNDDSIQWAETLKGATQSGIFGCSPMAGCGGGTSKVAIYGTPVVSGDLVYIAGYNGKIYAYKTDNLAQRWIYPREGYLKPFVGGMVIAKGKLFIGSSDGWVYALDALTGDKLYETKVGDKIWSTPAVDAENNTLYIGAFDKKLYAYSMDNLSLKWVYQTEGSIISTPLVYNGIVYFGSFDRNLYAINASDGSLKWKYTGKNWFWAQPEVLNGVLYAGCLDNFVYALDPATGAKIKDFDLKSPVSSRPVVVENLIIFASGDGIVYKIDGASKEISQIVDLKTKVDGPLTANAGIVYIHPQTNELMRINPVSGTVLPAISLKS